VECLEKNLKDKIKSNSDYYSSITSEILEEEYPQLHFKQQTELRWMEYIKKQLQLPLN
jgi:hypothetical protein